MPKRDRIRNDRLAAFAAVAAMIAVFFATLDSRNAEQGRRPKLQGQEISGGGLGSSEPASSQAQSSAETSLQASIADLSSSAASSAASSTPATCGNSVVEGSEQCDDGNSVNTDACVSCQTARCGDGHVRSGVEQCEPPNGAGCGATCMTQDGSGGGDGGAGTTGFIFDLPNEDPGARLQPPPHCGNNLPEYDLGEECDDGRGNGVTGCSRWCKILFCGDGIISPQLKEKCEPLRDANGNLYVNSCGKACTTPVCTKDKNNKETCVGGCDVIFLRACPASSQPLVPASKAASQAFIPAPPGRAELPTSAGTASSAVTLVRIPLAESVASFGSMAPPPPHATCGDKRIEEGEECDDGNTLSGDGCSGLCRLEPQARGMCGDGVLQQWEECDRAARNSDAVADACRRSCRRAYCGDGVKDSREQCDDGNTIVGDGCTSNCMLSMCNNGVLELGEECDDGRRNSDTQPDACSTQCLMPRCGDGVADPAFGEECDQGNANSDDERDGCRTDCLLSWCGDGTVDTEEQCDDGNDVERDRCDSSCKKPLCGDGVAEGDEKCDDGNGMPGDGCSSWCTIDVPGNPPPWLLVILLLTLLGLTTGWYVRRRMPL